MKMIKIENGTHNKLLEYGKKKETFDDLINRLLLEVKQNATRK